jgi:hypothetical protein
VLSALPATCHPPQLTHQQLELRPALLSHNVLPRASLAHLPQAVVWQSYGSPTEHPASSTADALVHVVVKSRDTASEPNVGGVGSKVVYVAAHPVAAAGSDTTAAAAAAARWRLIRKLDTKLRTLVKAAPAPPVAAGDHLKAGDMYNTAAPLEDCCSPLPPAALQHPQRPPAAAILRQTTTLLKHLLRRRNKRSSGCTSSGGVSSARGKGSTKSTACPAAAAAAVPQIAAAATEQLADAQAVSAVAVAAAQQGAVRASSEVAAVALLPRKARQAASLLMAIPVPPAMKAAEGAASGSGSCGQEQEEQETPDSLQLRLLTPHLAGGIPPGRQVPAWQHVWEGHREQLACRQRMQAAAAAPCHHPVIWGFDLSVAVMVAT